MLSFFFEKNRTCRILQTGIRQVDELFSGAVFFLLSEMMSDFIVFLQKYANSGIMKRNFFMLLLFAVLCLISCDSLKDSLTVRQDISFPSMNFRVSRQQQKGGAGLLLMDETFSLNVDSLMEEMGYGSSDISKFLKNTDLTKIFFELKDTSVIKKFDFIDSARATFSTVSVPETTVARLAPKAERPGSTILQLEITMKDITSFIRSKERIRLRFYGGTAPECFPEGVDFVDVLVGGSARMELRPEL